MGEFTAAELQNISAAVLDYHIRDGVLSQHIQEKPLLNALKGVQKTFPGGKGAITKRVKFDTTTTWQGFSHDDTVTYQNPANMREASYTWKEMHAGIQMTLTELKHDGISVNDSANGKSKSMHSGRDKTALAGLLDDKIDDMAEGMAEGMWDMFWNDGSQDASLTPGVLSIVVDDPTSATVVGGIDQAANVRWRNRASLSIAANLGNASTQVLSSKLNQEYRQLRRYGGKPNRIFAGSDLLDQLENEARAKGNYTLSGWADKGAIDMGVNDPKMKGMVFEYEPWLDDNSRSKYCYFLELGGKGIHPMVMEGEDMKRHNPARPENKYVIYQAVTWTGGLVAWRRNGCGVYSIA